MKLLCKLSYAIFIFCVASSQAIAQEVCFSEAKDNIRNWISENGKLFNDLSERYLKSPNPNTELIDYMGMKMPIAAALIIEGEQYGRLVDAKVSTEVSQAESCSGKTALVRGTYDFARDRLGFTTVLPEAATRIDFEEIRRGNILGGPNSVPNKALEVLNPFKWKL